MGCFALQLFSLAENTPDERVAIAVHARRRQAEEQVSLLNFRGAEQLFPLHGADGESRQIVRPGFVAIGHFGRFPAEEDASRLYQVAEAGFWAAMWW